MTTTTDAAALIAEAHGAARVIMRELRKAGIDVQPENDLILRLASALEAALERETRLREALQSVRGWLKEPSEPLIALGVANHALGDAP